jgi:ribosomal protein S27E
MVKRCRTCGSVITREPHNSTDLLWYCGHSCAARDTNRWRRYTPGTKKLRCVDCSKPITIHSHASPTTARCADCRRERLRARKAAQHRRRRQRLTPTSTGG